MALHNRSNRGNRFNHKPKFYLSRLQKSNNNIMARKKCGKNNKRLRNLQHSPQITINITLETPNIVHGKTTVSENNTIIHHFEWSITLTEHRINFWIKKFNMSRLVNETPLFKKNDYKNRKIIKWIGDNINLLIKYTKGIQ